jgi:hypothetical protein
MVNRGELCGETWCDCGDLDGRFRHRKTCHFFKLFFRIIPVLGEFDGAVERGLDRGQVWRNWTRPSYRDTGEGFGDEEAVPGAELPGAVGMDVAGVHCGVDELGELGDAGLGDHGRTSRAVGGDGTVVAGKVGALEVAEPGGAVSGAGAADGEKAHVLCGAGDQFAVEALADEEGNSLFAEGPYAGEQAAVPEGVDGGRRHVEADGGTGFADVFVAESGTETQRDDARNPRNDGENDALFQGVGGGHILSLPLRCSRGALQDVGYQFSVCRFSVVSCSWRANAGGSSLRSE